MPEIKKNKKRERAVAFVVVRLSSSRFSAKQFQLIGNKPILRWIVEALRQCNELDEIVITTVAEKANEPLKEFAEQEGLPCFWYDGEVDHVTTRLRNAAETYNADICVLVSGDCPLIHAPSIDQMIDLLRNSPETDIVRISPDENGQIAALEGISIARIKAWQLADDLSDTPELKEHQFPVIGKYPHLFKKKECLVSKDLYTDRHRFSVDTWADIEFMNTLYDELKNKNDPFDLPHVVSLLNNQPDLRRLNAHVHQRRLIEDIKRILFIVDAGSEFGYGHLMRCRELALQLVEHLGYPVTFLIDDEGAAELLGKRGFRVILGAWERPSKAKTRSPNNYEQINENLVNNYDLIILDIYGRRNIPSGWREKYNAAKPFVVLDNIRDWTNEANLIIIPGITGPVANNNLIINKLSSKNKSRHHPKFLDGQNYIILRREIQRAQNLNLKKDIDILAYLHPLKQRKMVSRFVDHYNIKARVVNGFDPNFPQLLTRSRFFLGSFGYSFYEALALDAYPVAWPLSDSHRKDAIIFYQNIGLPPVIIDQEDNLKTILYPLLALDKAPKTSIKDGTPAIVQEVAKLLQKPPERNI